MIESSVKVTQSNETRVSVVERRCEGLNIGQLRAFVEQADVAGLTDKTHVYLTDKLQVTTPFHDVEITSWYRESRTEDVEQPVQANGGDER